jgi:uncharacterized protein involved in exopolysaccharide biosynthesis
MTETACSALPAPAGMGAWDFAILLARHWRKLILVPLTVGSLTLAYSFTIPPTFTAKTVFLPPQQSQSAAGAALASLGPLASLAGGAVGIKSPADQYISLLLSQTVADRMIARFDLVKLYETPLMSQTRRALAANTRVSLGKKDGLITIEVDDHDAKRAADMANQYASELQRLTGELAITEAQQRRIFFEKQLDQTKQRLTAAQQALQSGGLSPGLLKSEPKAAADTYAKLRAETTAAEVRLQTKRTYLNESSPEIQQGLATLTALRAQLAQLETSQVATPEDASGYISRYREFKYEETLFELFARQYEAAKVDESRDGALIQVVDPATAPDRKSKPVRSTMALGATVAAFVLLVLGLVVVEFTRIGQQSPESRAQWETFKRALRLRQD